MPDLNIYTREHCETVDDGVSIRRSVSSFRNCLSPRNENVPIDPDRNVVVVVENTKPSSCKISLEMAIQHVEVDTRRDVVSRIFLVEDLA